MKNLFALIVLMLTVSAPVFAQETTYTTPNRGSDVQLSDEQLMENYQRVLKAQYNVDLRAAAIEDLGLSGEEADDFTDFWLGYGEELDRLDRKRTRLIKNFREEMAEDDSAKDEENERADFIENYWEINIDAMETRKDAFDVLEDIIGAERALRFFAMEENYANQVTRMRLQKMFEKQPTSIILLSPVRSDSSSDTMSPSTQQPAQMDTPKRMYKN